MSEYELTRKSFLSKLKKAKENAPKLKKIALTNPI